MKGRGWLIGWVLCLVLAGCSTARDRDYTTNLIASDAAKDAGFAALLTERFRTGSVYLDYSTILEVDALYMDLAYRRVFAQEMAKQYFYDDPTRFGEWAKETQEYENFYGFLVVVYSGTGKNLDFGSPSSHWQAFLRDDEGDVLRPNLIKKLYKNDKKLLFLQKYFVPLDRWGELYWIQFPKLHSTIPQGSQAVELVISGIQGQARLRWEEAPIFLQDKADFPLE